MRPEVCLLLINLGSPKQLTLSSVRAYLKEFLSDPRVIDIHPILRSLLLQGIILPFRSKKTLKAYEKIWTSAGSPLLQNSIAFAKKLEAHLPMEKVSVHLAMRYGAPSIRDAVMQIAKGGFRKVIVLPLYPHYASSSTGTALEEFYSHLKGLWNIPEVLTIPAFYNRQDYLQVLADHMRTELPWDHHLVFSFHGLPLRHMAKSESVQSQPCAEEFPCPMNTEQDPYCYRAQCYATARRLAQLVGRSDYSVGFQSRLGRDPWIKPYTDFLLPELLAKGIRKVSVVCPSFVADCLETIEEIGMRAKDDWLTQGGESLKLISCLNDDSAWVEVVADWVNGNT